MKKINWSIHDSGKLVDSGTITAENDKTALGEIMLEQEGKLAPDKSYSFTAGELTGSSYGDELERSANVAVKGMDEDAPMDAPHHFVPDPADVGLDPYSLDRGLREAQEAADKIIAGTPIDSGQWSADAAAAHKLRRERIAGRRTFTPDEAAEIVKHMVGRDVYCGSNPVWTEKEIDSLIGKLRCPASPSGPNGHHDWTEIRGSRGSLGCVGHGHERCCKCGNSRVKRTAPRTSDPKTFNRGQGTRHNPTRQRVGPDPIVGRALTSGQKGDIIEVELNDGSIRQRRCVEDVTSGERVCNDASGRVYGAPRGAVIKTFTCPMPPPNANQIQAQQVMDRTVRDVVQNRQAFANMHGVSIGQVKVSFLHDEATFSLIPEA